MPLLPPPSFETTIKRADGETIGDYGWVTDSEYFDDDDDPVELIEETWVRSSVRTYWHLPSRLYECTKAGDCEEDAVAWEQQSDGRWEQTCKLHAEVVR